MSSVWNGWSIDKPCVFFIAPYQDRFGLNQIFLSLRMVLMVIRSMLISIISLVV